MILVIFCIGVTFKYHYRFNIDRKFHELNNVNFSDAVGANKLSKKLFGLNWITPRLKNKKKQFWKLKHLNDFKNILKKDKEKKMVLSNYSLFFSLT